MPKPTKGESKQDYLSRCTKELISSEGKNSEQAFAVCNAYWDEAKSKASKALTLTATLNLWELTNSDNDPPQNGFMMTAYTGQILDMGWLGRYVFSIDGMSAKSKIPILREHKRDRVVGYSKNAWAENGNFLISGEFSKATRDAKEVLALSKEGYPWQASVGITPKKIKSLDSDKETFVVNGQEVSGPIEIWLESKVGEVSFVSLGADDDTAAIALNEPSGCADQPISPPEGMKTMNLEDLKTKHPDLYQEVFSLGAGSVDIQKLQAEAKIEGINEERERVGKILEAQADAEMTRKAIAECATVEAAGWMFFEAEKTNRTKKLEEMQAVKPESAGQRARESELSDKNDFVKLRDAYQAEHKCGLGTATAAVAKQYPDIHKAWIESQN
jgi:hypothetical protein